MRIGSGPFLNVDWLYEIRNARGFTRGVSLAASVGNLSEIQLFNPAGSGITTIVHRFFASPSPAQVVNLRQFNTGLATLVGTGFNLNVGGAAAVSEIRTANPAAASGTFWAPIPLDSVTELLIVQEWHAMLGAGEGILLSTDVANVALRVRFEWIEF